MRNGWATVLGTVTLGIALSMIAKDLTMLLAGLAAFALLDRLRAWLVGFRIGLPARTKRFLAGN